MKKVLNKNNLILIILFMTLFNLMMPITSYAATISINDMMKETVSGWYLILRALAIASMLILLLVLSIKAAITRNAEDGALLKRMLADWLVALILILFIHYFMIMCISLNESAVSGAEELGKNLSGLEELSEKKDGLSPELSLYESAITKAYEVKFTPGTIGMILYMMLVYYAYKFTFVYLKRYVNVLVLILIAPITCVFYGFRKVLSGKSFTLKKWFKEFIYNVFLQSLHAILYASVAGLTLKFSADENFIGAILTLILFGVIFKVDKLVRKLFNKVGGDTSVTVSKVEASARRAYKRSAGAAMSGALGSISALNENMDDANQLTLYMKDKIDSNKITFKDVTAGVKADVAFGVADTKNSLKNKVAELKDIAVAAPDTLLGKNKVVTQEEIAREQEKMDNAGILGKTWYATLDVPKNIKKQTEKLKKETVAFIERKRKEINDEIEGLHKDIETIRKIPTVMRDVKELPQYVVNSFRNPKTQVVDDKYEAIFDLDIDVNELQERYKKLVGLSKNDILSALVLARGLETFFRAPKLGLVLMAEKNYEDMMHLEIPFGERKRIAGVKKEKSRKLYFKKFGNSSIRAIEKTVVKNACWNFAGLKSLSKVSKGVKTEKITYRRIPRGADVTTIRFKGKAKAARQLHMNTTLLVRRLVEFKDDAQIAEYINMLNALTEGKDRNQLTNLSPAMLKRLEEVGVIRRLEANGDFKGGYVILDQAIDNVLRVKKINDFIDNNPENVLAQKINQFLIEHPENELALKLSEYAINNPESTLANILDKISLTEDGKIVANVQSFVFGENIDFSQLGIVKDNQIEQTIMTEDGRMVKQIIDLQGNVVVPAKDENGNDIEFTSVNGRIMQTIVTPEGNLVQQVLSQDGSTVKPLVFVDNFEQKPTLVNINKMSGVIAQVAPDAGVIQIINKETGKTETLTPENGNIQIVKNEDGGFKIVNVETGVETKLEENYIIQVIKPKDSTLQVIDVANQTLEVATGETALQMLIEQGFGVSQKVKDEFLNGAVQFNEVQSKVVNFENVNGIIANISPVDSEIQIVTKDGKKQSINANEGTMQLVKNEDGSFQIVDVQTGEEIKLEEGSIIQIINPKNSMIQVFNLENQTLETAVREDALQLAQEYGVQMTSEVEKSFIQNLVAPFNEVKVEKFEDIKGTIVDLTPEEGQIRILDKNGKAITINPENANIQIVKNEDGQIQILKDGKQLELEDGKPLELGEGTVVQVINPKALTVQVINLDNQTVETAVGASSVSMMVNQDMQFTPEVENQIIKEILKAPAQPVKVEKFENVAGTIVDLAPSEGEIRVVDKNGEAITLRPEGGNIQIVKDENGKIQVIEDGRPVELDEGTIIQVVKPGDASVQIINTEKQTIETAVGANTIQVMEAQGIEFSSDIENQILRKVLKDTTRNTKTETFDDLKGVVVDFASGDGELRIVGKDGEVRTIKSENVQIVKAEDGTIEVFEAGKKVELGESSVLEVVKPNDATVQIFDLENKRVETTEGASSLQILEERGMDKDTNLKQSLIDGIVKVAKSKPKVEKIDAINGVVAEVDSKGGSFQVVNNSTGEIENFSITDGTMEIVRTENGLLQIVNKETRETVMTLGEEMSVHISNPNQSMLQVIDVKNQTKETSYGDVATRILEEKRTKQKVKSDLTALTQAVTVDLATGKTESVSDILFENQILSAVGESILKDTPYQMTEDERLGKLNNLLGQINEYQSTETINELFNSLEQESKKVLVEVSSKKPEQLKKLTDMGIAVEQTIYSPEITPIAPIEDSISELEQLANILQSGGLDAAIDVADSTIDMYTSKYEDLRRTVAANVLGESSTMTGTSTSTIVNEYEAKHVVGATDVYETTDTLDTSALQEIVSTMGTTSTYDASNTSGVTTTRERSVKDDITTTYEMIDQVDETHKGKTTVTSDTSGEIDREVLAYDTIKAFLAENARTTNSTTGDSVSEYISIEDNQNLLQSVVETVGATETKSDTRTLYDEIIKKVTGKTSSVKNDTNPDVEVITDSTVSGLEGEISYTSGDISSSSITTNVTGTEPKPDTKTMFEDIIRNITGKNDVTSNSVSGTTDTQIVDEMLGVSFETVNVEEGKNRTRTKTNRLTFGTPAKKSKITDISEDKPEEMFFSVTGAVKQPGRILIQAGKKVRDAIMQVGGFTENADKKAVESLLNTIISKTNSNIYVPEIEMIEFEVTGAVRNPGKYMMKCNYSRVSNAIEAAGGFAKNANKKAIRERRNELITKVNTSIDVPELKAGETDDDSEDENNKITCFISGFVAISGYEELKKGERVADLIIKAGNLTINQNAIVVKLNSERIVDINYILSDGDSIYIDELTEDELDNRRGYSTGDIKYIIKTEFEEYKKRNPKEDNETEVAYLEKILKNNNIIYMIADKVNHGLKHKSISLSKDEIEDRIKKFLKREIEIQKKKKEDIKQQNLDFLSGIFNNLTIVNGSRVLKTEELDEGRVLTIRRNKTVSKNGKKKEKSIEILTQIQESLKNSNNIA